MDVFKAYQTDRIFKEELRSLDKQYSDRIKKECRTNNSNLNHSHGTGIVLLLLDELGLDLTKNEFLNAIGYY